MSMTTSALPPDSTPTGAPALPLEDIIVPDGVSAWPPALGWWLLGILCIIAVATGIFFYRRYQKKWGYRKQALVLVDNLFMQWQHKKLNDSEICQQLLQTLKRTALSAYPNHSVNSLYGKEWVDRLIKQAPTVDCTHRVKTMICSSQYQRKITLHPEILYQFCQEWIRQHHAHWQGADA